MKKKSYNVIIVRNLVILFCLLGGFVALFSLRVNAADANYPSFLPSGYSSTIFDKATFDNYMLLAFFSPSTEPVMFL